MILKESAPTFARSQPDTLIIFKIVCRFYWFYEPYAHYRIIFTVLKHAFVLAIFGNVNAIWTALKNGAHFEDLIANVSWLSSLIFGGCIIYNIRATNLEFFNRIELNPPFKYPTRRLKKISNVNGTFLKVMYTICAMFLTGPMIILEITDCDNSTLNDKGCGTVYPLDFFVNTSQRPYRELCNVVLFFLGAYILVAVITTFSFLQIILMLLEDCLAEYKRLLKSFRTVKIKTFRRRNLVKAYELHQYCVRRWRDVQDLFKWPLFVQHCCTAVIAGFIITSAMIFKFDILAIGLLGCHVCGTAFLGYVGEYIQQLSDKFKDATFYAVPWDGDVDTAKFLMFMNLNLRKGMFVQVGNGGPYNNKLALMIYKTMYSMVMLLRHFTRKV